MPIHVAAAYGHADVIDILLQNGAKLVVPENSDMTPMALAISGGHWKLFLALIDKYADAEHAQREGREPITNRSYFSFQLILAKMFCRVGELVEILQGRSTQKDEQSLLATAWTAPRQRPRINQDDFSGAVLESNKKLTSPLAALSVADDGDLWGSSDIDGGYESPPVEIRKLPPGGLCEVCLGIFHQRLGNIPVDPMSGVMEDVISLVVHGKAPQIDESVIPTGIDSTSLWFVHHVSPSSLQSSYDLGCYICRRIWGRVEPGMRDKILAMDTVHVDSETASLMDPFLRCKYFDAHKMRQNTPMESDGVSDQNFWLFHFNSVLQDMLNWPPMEFPGFSCIPMKDREQENLRTVLDSSTGSPRSLHFAASQFSNCLKTHPKCKSSQLWLPTRLICIDEAASQGRVRLVLSQGITPEAYCTLSHCWGKAEFLKLEKSDLTAFYDGIDLASLPKTFRDAIYVTDTLGIRYIWIDSLCIIQDDANDWLREASQMHLVYANSACNICATASDDSMGGLFTERDTDVFSSCDVEIPWLGDGGYFRLLDAHIWTFQVLHPPLNRRAWVVQERLLAPRLLHFGPIQIYWQCLETITSEEFPSGLPVNPATQAQRSRRLLHSDDSNLDGETSDILCSDWPEIVSNYTSAKLSHPEDKIIAFAGITKRFELILKDECSAGLWRNDLEHGLLWHVKPYRQSDRTSTRPLVYRAPSFSWMSVEGRIDFEGRIPSTSPVMNVLSFTVDESPGVIRSASLCVECSLKPMRVYRSSPAVPIWLGKFRFGTPDLRYGLFVSCTVFMDTDGSWEAQYFAMPIQSTTTNPIRLLGLVLEETGMRKGQFKRVGYFRTLGEEAVLLRGQYGDEHTYPCESYDEAAKKHIITIV